MGIIAIGFVARRLRAARVATGIHELSSFATMLGIPIERYEKIEGGTKPPTFDELVSIARITGKSLDFLLTGQTFVKLAACGLTILAGVRAAINQASAII